MATTAPKDSNQIPAWKGTTLLEPYAVNMKTEEVPLSDPERPSDVPPAAPVQAARPQVVSSTSEEMAAHSTALTRLFRAATDLEIAERDERDALEKAAALTVVKKQCLRARDDAKRALAAAGRSCRLAAEAHHAELLRQLAASTASLAASLAATSDDGDLGVTSSDAAAAASSSATTSAPTSTPVTTTISAATSTTYSATRSPAVCPLSGADRCPPASPFPSPPTGNPTDPVSIVEFSASSTPSVAATPHPETLARMESTDLPFLNASVEDVRQADGLDRLATEDISFAATRVLRFCSARESPAITVAAVVDRAATSTSRGFTCAVNNLVTALRRFHAYSEHSWFSSSSPATAVGVPPPFPSPRATSFSSSSSSPNHSRAPVITATGDSTGTYSPQHVRPTSTSGRRTASSSSNVNSFRDDNTATSTAYVHRQRHRDVQSHPRRPANIATTALPSTSDRPRDDNDDGRSYNVTPTLDASGSSRRSFSDLNSTATASVPWGCRGGFVGVARLRRDDNRDLLRRSNTRGWLRRDDSRDRVRRDTNARPPPRGDNNSDRPRGDSTRGGPRPDDARDRSRGDNNRQQTHQERGRDRSRADDNSNRGRPRDGSNRGHRLNDNGGRPRADNNRGQPRRDDSRDRPRGANNDNRLRDSTDDRPRAINDERQRANSSNNRDRPLDGSRDCQLQHGGRANGPDDRHPNLKTDDDGNCVGNRGRRGHRWGVKGEVRAPGFRFDFSSGFAAGFASGCDSASDSASGSVFTIPSNAKRPSSPSRPTSTRPSQRPRCRVADHPSSSYDSFDVVVSPPTLLSNAAAVVTSPDSAARPLVSSPSTTACAQRATMDSTAAAVLATSSVHAVEQADVGIGMH